MKTAKKVWIIIAVCLVIVGAIISALSLMTLNFNFALLSTEKFISNEHNITEDFSNIKIDVNTSDIEFVRSQTQDCMVVSIDTEKVKHNVFVENGTLTVSVEDNRKWYDYIGISFGEMSLTVHLPKEKYDALNIEADTSDINVPKDFTFSSASVETDTGDIEFLASLSGALKIGSDTGNIKIDGINAESIILENDTGKTELNEVKCENINVDSDTGDISFINTLVLENITAKSDTGDVIFEESDAELIYVKTSTGDVKGTLLSQKVFITETNTGNVNVPKFTTGGKCEITTNTGDIHMEVNPSEKKDSK